MIIRNNEDALRVRAEWATEEEVGGLIATLEKELYYSEYIGRAGVGLAASQIGHARQVAIVRLGEYKVDLVNCRIEKGYDKQIFRDEGCLSFPGRVEDTMRYQEIYVVNNLVYPHSFIASGLFAVVVQHEIDHMNGILLSDNAIPKVKKQKVGPNDLCLCGSNRKYKKCCMLKEIR